MPLITKTPFTTGSVYTADVANELANVVFDDQSQYFGHYSKIADTDLSDAAGAIKQRVAGNELNLKVTAGTGLNALYTSGTTIIGNTNVPVNAGTLTLTASSTHFIYVAANGTVQVTTRDMPTVRAALARVVTNVSSVTAVTDLRAGYRVEVVQPFVSSVRNFGGRGEQGAFVAAGGETLGEGEYYYTDFTVGVGKTITISRLARIFCTGDMNIAGVVNVAPATLGGGNYGFVATGFQSMPGAVGQGLGSVIGETPAPTYSHILSLVGSGGCGGGFVNNGVTRTSGTRAGGSGGGCFAAEVAGTINISGTINASGTAGQDSVVAGNTSEALSLGAGSGGSGGLILLKSLTNCIIQGTLNVSGGAGGAGVVNNGTGVGAEAGCGGGGGRIVIYSPLINTTGSVFNLAGGAAGAGGIPTATVSCVNATGGSFGGLGGSAIAQVGTAGGIGVTSLYYAVSVG